MGDEFDGNVQTVVSITDNRENRKCGCKEGLFRVLSGFVLVVLIAFAWTGATQFGRSTFVKDFNAPYFNTWFTITWQILMFPLSMLPLLCQATSVQDYISNSGQILGKKGFTFRSFGIFLVRHAVPFNVISIIANYLMFRALKVLNPGVVAPVFASQSTFVYILSILFLGDKLLLLRVTSVLLCVGGITVMGYTQGFDNPSSIGIVYTVFSAFFAATYQVAFKRRLGDATSGQVSLFISCVGLTNILFFPIIFLLQHFDQEHIIWQQIPWQPVVGSAVLALAFTFLVHFGVAVTYPLFITVGTLLGVPLSALVDRVFRHADFGTFKIVASLMIVCGFLLMLIPTWRVVNLERRIRCCCKHDGGESSDDDYSRLLNEEIVAGVSG